MRGRQGSGPVSAGGGAGACPPPPPPPALPPPRPPPCAGARGGCGGGGGGGGATPPPPRGSPPRAGHPVGRDRGRPGVRPRVRAVEAELHGAARRDRAVPRGVADRDGGARLAVHARPAV